MSNFLFAKIPSHCQSLVRRRKVRSEVISGCECIALLYGAPPHVCFLPSSDWTLDVTPPGVDAQDGWQYSHSFTDPDDQWVSEAPPQLERLLTGNGAVAAGLGGSSRNRSSSRASTSTGPHPHGPHTWVRRRRWVRVMRRRLDIPPLPFLQPDGAMYHLVDGQLIPFLEHDGSDYGGSDGQELGAMPSSGLGSQDYVARARYLVGAPQDGHDADSALDARRMIAKLERATTELRQGILSQSNCLVCDHGCLC